MTSEQKLPKWFDGVLYTEGSVVQNRFSGEEIELSAAELSMYDFIMGTVTMMELGLCKSNSYLNKAMGWFRKENPEAYMVLLD